MKLVEQSTFDFNKELLFGEVGAWVGAPLAAHIALRFTTSSRILSIFAVLGAIIGSSIIWLSMRYYDQKKHDSNYSAAGLAKDIAYFTPVAGTIAFFVYNPTVYFISEYLLTNHHSVYASVISSQAVAFTLLIILLNIYRYILIRSVGKKL